MRHPQALRSLALLAALALSSGCSQATASSGSERSVLASFDAADLKGMRVLNAPYDGLAPALTPAETALGVGGKDAMPSELQDLEDAGFEELQNKLGTSSKGLSVLRLPAGQRSPYFEDQARFINVSIDGNVRFQVPKLERLQELGATADSVVVIDGLEYSNVASTTETKQRDGDKTTYSSHTFRALKCEGNFLVWDYRRARVLAAGKVSSTVAYVREMDPGIWKKLGRGLLREVFSKRPFEAL